jgi:hypothetical protein
MRNLTINKRQGNNDLTSTLPTNDAFSLKRTNTLQPPDSDSFEGPSSVSVPLTSASAKNK